MNVRRYSSVSLVVLATAGGALFCCKNSPEPGSDAALDSGVDAGRREGGTFTLDGGTARDGSVTAEALGCTPEATWDTVFPFSPNFPMQVAPKSAWAAAKPAERACANGQARCTELVLPNQLGSSTPYVVAFASQPEDSGFLVFYLGDPVYRRCARTLRLVPTGSGFEMAGALLVSATSGFPIWGPGPDLVIERSVESRQSPAQVALSGWDGYAPRFTTPTAVEYPETRTTQGRLFLFDAVQGLTEARDATTGALVGSGRVPADFASVEERFAVAGDLWFEVGRNTSGHIELWRVNDKGEYRLMLQKQGVDLYGSWTDGQTLFWVEHTNPGPNATWDRVELWMAPFSKDPTALRAQARRVVDLTASGQASKSVAHAGYFALRVAPHEVLVVRGRDGAMQRVPIADPWSHVDPVYVDENQLWFLNPVHGLVGSPASFGRIALNPWP